MPQLLWMEHGKPIFQQWLFWTTYSQAFPKKPMKLSWQLLFSKIWDQQFLPMDVPKYPNQCNKLQ
jgi:hypothetical protein